MDGATFRSALRQGECVFGTLIVSPSPLWPRAIVRSGLDFVFIDMEHTSLTRDQVAWMCQTYSANDLAPVVRLPSADVHAVANAIDIGAVGVIAPYVESPDVARQLVGAVRLRPLKGLRRDQALSNEPLEDELTNYLASRNDNHALILNIESVPAINNLDAILEVSGIDAVLIGPHDLSCSLGIPEQYDHPEFMAAVERIFRKARSKNIAAGIHYTGEPAKQIEFLKRGANLLIHCADITLFADRLTHDLKTIRAALGSRAKIGETKPDGDGLVF